MKANIAPDAAGQYIKELSDRLPASAGFSREQHAFIAILRQLQGKTLPATDAIVSGVAGSLYIVTDTVNHHNEPQKSKVVAVPLKYITAIVERDVPTPVEPSTDHMQYEMFKRDGLLTVRVRTPWVDGFCAFLRA